MRFCEKEMQSTPGGEERSRPTALGVDVTPEVRISARAEASPRWSEVLFWDGTGLCVLATRLSKGRFAAPWEKKRGAVLEWTTSELALFLEGSELVGRVALSPPAWTPDERRVTFT